MKKYILLIILFLISLFAIHNVYALDGSYSSSNFQIGYYSSPSGGIRSLSGYSNGLNVSHSLNGNYLESLYIAVTGSNSIIYKAGNTYTFTFKVNFNPKHYSSLDNTYTTSSIKVYGSPTTSSSDMSLDNITSSSLSISNISNDTYGMTYTYKFVPDTDLKYVLLVCYYPYSLMDGNLDYVYALTTVRVVDLTVTYQQGIGSAIDNQTIVIQNQTDNIINNNNQNTQDIIDNQQQNTQDIINNQNSNTQQQIESQKVCKVYDRTNVKTDNTGLLSTGSTYSNPNMGITDYLKIYNSNVTLLNTYNYNLLNFCFYNVNKTLISCDNPTSYADNTVLTLPNNSYYVRFTIYKPQNKPTFKICTAGNQAMNDSINNVNDSLNNADTTGANSDAGGFFSGFTTNNHGLTSIITKPLQFINGLSSAVCYDLSVPMPFVNQNVTLPCMLPIYQRHFGSFLTLYQTITTGFIAYWVCVNIFRMVKGFKNPEDDQVEVMDL